MTAQMPNDYLALANERWRTPCHPHRQPEDFGYDFREWVSPYTKGAHHQGGIALVLQDWASSDGLAHPRDPGIQEHGRSLRLRTNQRLVLLLERLFGLTLSQVYATNAFPFIKAGRMDAPLNPREVYDTVQRFTARELAIVKPTLVLAVGSLPYKALRRIGIDCIHVPHPAARIGNVSAHEAKWRVALSGAMRVDVLPQLDPPDARASARAGVAQQSQSTTA